MPELTIKDVLQSAKDQLAAASFETLDEARISPEERDYILNANYSFCLMTEK